MYVYCKSVTYFITVPVLVNLRRSLSLTVEYCVFVEAVHSSVRQADGQPIHVDQGKVSESTVVHAGHVWNIRTHRQFAACFTGN